MDAELEALRGWLAETRDEPLEGMAAFFDKRLDGYEEHMSPWAAHYRWMAELLPKDTRTLLDVGCGSGLELDAILAKAPALRVTGVDLSAAMLARLRAKHPDAALTLVCADYFEYDPGEARFDAAVSFQTLHHTGAAAKTALFQKLRRALQPGGVYLECDYIATSPAMEELVFAECARRRARDGVPAGAFVHFDTPLTLEHELAALRAAGFASAELVGFLPGDGHTAMLRALR